MLSGSEAFDSAIRNYKILRLWLRMTFMRLGAAISILA